MIKNLTSLFALALFCLIFSCKNDPVSPTPYPTKPEETTIDKSLLTGWWAPVEKGKAKIYFGTDNFFYQDTITRAPSSNPDAPIPGFWSLSGQSIKYSPTQNGIFSTTYNVVTLTGSSLVIKNDATSTTYVKINLPAITSTAITTIADNLVGPRGIITDNAGNVYFCDATNNLVKKISAADGKISIFAGTGRKFQYTNDFKPYQDNIAATAADIYIPSGLAIDAAGNIYISEANIYNGRVDKVSTDGKISLVAGSLQEGLKELGDGGLAVNALLREPVGLAVDVAGNLYIADIGNKRIRKVTLSNKYITTVAGNGNLDNAPHDNIMATTASMQPLYLSVDAEANIYFSDIAFGRIRKVTASTGIISTIGRTQFNGSNGNGDGGLISNASVGFPWGLCMDANGDIYFIGDFMSVRKIDKTTNIITTIAGNGYAGFVGDGLHATAYSLSDAYQVAVDNKGNIYVSDVNRIRKIANR